MENLQKRTRRGRQPTQFHMSQSYTWAFLNRWNRHYQDITEHEIHGERPGNWQEIVDYNIAN